jgi:hypothetical protein
MSGSPPEDHLLGSGDIQSLADLSNGYQVVKTMHILPVGRETLVRLTIAVDSDCTARADADTPGQNRLTSDGGAVLTTLCPARVHVIQGCHRRRGSERRKDRRARAATMVLLAIGLVALQLTGLTDG